jgi:hypothetical protein
VNVQKTTSPEVEKIRCSKCGEEIDRHQKFCGTCGAEIGLTSSGIDLVNHSEVSKNVPVSASIMNLYQAMALPGRIVAILLIIFNLFSIPSLFSSENSSDDLSRCNGNYDANILKTYGVFRCPSIYGTSPTASGLNVDALLGLLIINIVFFVPLYIYSKKRIKQQNYHLSNS